MKPPVQHEEPARPKTNGARAGANESAAEHGALDLPMAGEIERLVRAHGTLFLVTDKQGDIAPAGARELGMFHQDTRHLSSYALRIANAEAVRLSAETSHDAYNQVDLMLTDLEQGEFLDDPKNFLHIRRRQILDGGLLEEIVFTNFLPRGVSLTMRVTFGADFADIFEVRGAKRAKRGRYHPPLVDASSVTLSYEGLCGTRYSTTIAFSPAPAELAADHALFEIEVAPGEDARIEVRVIPARDGLHRTSAPLPFARRAERLTQAAEAFRANSTEWSCDDGLLQQTLEQSCRDLYALRIQLPSPDPYGRDLGEHAILGAGIPWFCAPFGRDALITAYEALTVNPDLATEALRTLAAYQGTKHDDAHEEEPGKILHELRFGEMARCGEIPHSPYYGSVDATPLFVVLLDAHHDFAHDVAFLREMRPALTAALGWIDASSAEGTRFVTYQRKTAAGLDNQGWKDSRAGVSFPDGRRAEPPIALCEVQGYCIDAYRRGARLFRALGDEERATQYEARAERMRELFERRFWFPEAGRYAYAIDGRDRPLPTVVSNVGHLLWSGVPPRDRAAATARLLVASNMYSGFGVRTLASDQPVYNPLSYHNGTVWPHDNALIAMGLAHYGHHEECVKVVDGLHHAIEFFLDRRIPELFCGIGRRNGPLVRYPVAGSPQAWSAAAPFLMLQAMLGICADAPQRRLVVKNPHLPPYVRRVELRNMRVGDALVGIRFRRLGARVHVDRLDVSGGALKTEIEIG